MLIKVAIARFHSYLLRLSGISLVAVPRVRFRLIDITKEAKTLSIKFSVIAEKLPIMTVPKEGRGGKANEHKIAITLTGITPCLESCPRAFCCP